jgi:hypothetical protein
VLNEIVDFAVAGGTATPADVVGNWSAIMSARYYYSQLSVCPNIVLQPTSLPGPLVGYGFQRFRPATDRMPTGFIVLEHDLYEQTVELATGYILPDALARTSPKLNIMPVSQCLGLNLTDAYMETNNNSTHPPAQSGMSSSFCCCICTNGASVALAISSPSGQSPVTTGPGGTAANSTTTTTGGNSNTTSSNPAQSSTGKNGAARGAAPGVASTLVLSGFSLAVLLVSVPALL